MNPFTLRTVRQLAVAGASACLVAAVGLMSSSAAEPAGPAADHGARDMHATMEQHWSEHLQSHLDRLAGRLEIKASQQAAWQQFSAAFKETMGEHPMMGRDGMDGQRHADQDADAAALARRHADRAEQHAQKLARLADATAALQQALSADQRQVFNEVARHFAHEHDHMAMMSHEDGHHGDHCSMRGHEHGHPYGHAENDDGDDADMGPHGHGPDHEGMRDAPHADNSAPGDMVH
jgi:hypothetical protein